MSAFDPKRTLTVAPKFPALNPDIATAPRPNNPWGHKRTFIKSHRSHRLLSSTPFKKRFKNFAHKTWEDVIRTKTVFALSASVAILSFAATARSAEVGVTALAPSEMKWSAQGGLALPGLEQTTLIGDPSKPGPYTIRLKFPAGFKVAPHTHPDSREVTVLSGTWYTGYGEKAEAANLKELPVGSFYTEPAGIAHYIEIREPTVIQVSGTGPSGRKFVSPDASK